MARAAGTKTRPARASSPWRSPAASPCPSASAAELTNKKIRRGAHRSVPALERDIKDWISQWNENPRPYVWVKTADEILKSIARYCERIYDSGH